MPLLRHLPDDPANIGEEAHVAHAVGLIENEYFHVGQVDPTRVNVIEQTPRARNYYFHSPAQRRELRSLAHAAVDRDATNLRITGQLDDLLVDLLGQFAGRGHDQARTMPRGPWLRRWRIGSTKAAVFPVPV